jgi:tRNA uridine 5-carboxymethylaminomethyl modification enzyme
LLDSAVSERVRAKADAVREEIARLGSATIQANDDSASILAESGTAPIRVAVRAIDLLKRPEVSYETIARISPPPTPLDEDAAAELEIEVKYAGYVVRQSEAIERFRRLEESVIPESLDYGGVSGLSTEARERLTRARPRSLGQAARLAGITPAAVSILAVHLKSRRVSAS